MNSKLRMIFVVAMALLCVATQAATPIDKHGALRVEEPQTIELFNGHNLDGWVAYLADSSLDPAKEFIVKDGVIHLSGKLGYLRTAKGYTDYKLEVEWRWPEEPSNSGIFQRVQPVDAPLPETFECQLQAGNAGDLVGLGGARTAQTADATEAITVIKKMKPSNEKPAGEWNRAEIICNGDVIDIYINGEHQNHVTGTSCLEGYVALQSEGGPIEFRGVKLTPLK
jgi:hypothetical protein